MTDLGTVIAHPKQERDKLDRAIEALGRARSDRTRKRKISAAAEAYSDQAVLRKPFSFVTEELLEIDEAHFNSVVLKIWHMLTPVAVREGNEYAYRDTLAFDMLPEGWDPAK